MIEIIIYIFVLFVFLLKIFLENNYFKYPVIEKLEKTANKGFEIFLVISIGTILVIAVINSSFVVFVKSLLFLSLFILSILIYLAGVYPANIAHKIVLFFANLDASRITSFWKLYDSNIFRRKIIIFSLFGFCFFAAVLNIIFFDAVLIRYYQQISSLKEILIVLSFLIFLSIIFLIDYLRSRKHLCGRQHEKLDELKNIVANLSIAAGITAPIVEIVDLETPTAYTSIDRINHFFVIHISVGLLKVLEKTELESVIAHEISHIVSGQILDFRTIAIFLSFLKALGGGFLILVLSAYNPYFFYIWAIIMLVLSFESHNGQSIYKINSHSLLYSIFIFFMPAFSLINLVGCIIYYSLSYNEDFYADLGSILLTRYPRGLYKALEIIKNNKKFSPDFFNTKINYLYFVGENIYSEIPQPQPPIELRQKLIMEVDNTVKYFSVSAIDRNIACPLCKTIAQHFKVDSHYVKNNIELDKCEKCGGIWFDNNELIYVANLISIGNASASFTPDKRAQESLLCPHCGVKLKIDKYYNASANIDLWCCPTCHGNFLTRQSIYNYGVLRGDKEKFPNNKN